MWNKLKKCQNMRELYLMIGDEGRERSTVFFLVFLALLPGTMTFLNLIGNLLFSDWYAPLYSLYFFSISGCLTVLTVFYMYEEFRLNKLKIRWSFSWLTCFGSMLAWAIVCTFFADDPMTSFLGTFRRADGLLSYFMYGGIMLSATRLKKTESKLKILHAFIIAAVPFSLVIVFRYFQVIVPFGIYTARAAVFDHFNHAGYYLNMAVVVSAGCIVFDGTTIKKVVVYACALSLFTYTLLVNDTFGAYLASAIVIFVILPLLTGLRKKEERKRLIVIFGVFGGISILSFCGMLPGTDLTDNIRSLFGDVVQISGGSGSHSHSEQRFTTGIARWYMWSEALKEVMRRPLVGHGPEGIYGSAYAERLANDRSANEYIQWALFLGIPGAAMYLGGLIMLAVDRIKNLKKLSGTAVIAGGAVFAYLISAFFGNTMFYTVCYLWMMIGLLAGKNPLNTETDL